MMDFEGLVGDDGGLDDLVALGAARRAPACAGRRRLFRWRLQIVHAGDVRREGRR